MKRKVLSLDERVKVIRLNKEGKRSRKIATILEVGKTQINFVIKNNAEILKQWESGANGDRQIVTARRCLYPAPNDKVYEWFCVARGKNIPLTDKMIQATAIFLSHGSILHGIY